MVSLNRIYTKTGDRGETGLVGGGRVPKDDVRIEAYGTVDELNACIGLVRERNCATNVDADAQERIDAALEQVQQVLFNLGASLATRAEDRRDSHPCVTEADVAWLEERIETWNAELPALHSFILPGGGPVGATLHLARTVCRRAERRICTLSTIEPIADLVLPYVNRLSDMLFVLGRWAALRLGEKETLWKY